MALIIYLLYIHLSLATCFTCISVVNICADRFIFILNIPYHYRDKNKSLDTCLHKIKTCIPVYIFKKEYNYMQNVLRTHGMKQFIGVVNDSETGRFLISFNLRGSLCCGLI